MTMALEGADRKKLIEIVRASIRAHLDGERQPDISSAASEALSSESGAFVTLHLDGKLRGCIGLISADEPLFQTISGMAVSAAFNDPRFSPLTDVEFDRIVVEISVLTPLERVEDPEKIEVGRDGLFIVMGANRGLLLPQVATENGFNRETFLDQTCVKAGLAPGCWREGAEIYSFQAEVFDDDEGGGEG